MKQNPPKIFKLSGRIFYSVKDQGCYSPRHIKVSVRAWYLRRGKNNGDQTMSRRANQTQDGEGGDRNSESRNRVGETSPPQEDSRGETCAVGQQSPRRQTTTTISLQNGVCYPLMTAPDHNLEGVGWGQQQENGLGFLTEDTPSMHGARHPLPLLCGGSSIVRS